MAVGARSKWGKKFAYVIVHRNPKKPALLCEHMAVLPVCSVAFVIATQAISASLRMHQQFLTPDTLPR